MAWLGGCDISKWQGSINWPALDPGTAFVVIKASGGDDGLYRDSQLTANQTGARSIAPTTGVGYYHFAGGGDPVAEADYFLEQVGDLQEGEFLALDWEIGHADPVGWCTAFVNEVHTKTNVWPLLYVNASTLNGYAWTPVTANCGVWVADWAVSPDANVATSYTYVMQQYKDNGTFPGIAGNVDSDAFFGTLDELRMYGYKATPSPSPTPAPPATPPTPVIVPAQPQQGSGTNNEQGTVIESRNFTENKTEIYSNLFNTRKKEYETQPVLPENLDFSIEKDEPIQNMEELIEQHRLEREKDL